MNRRRLIESFLLVFTGVLFALEPVIVMRYLDKTITPTYFCFTLFKFNSVLLVYWLISDSLQSTKADTDIGKLARKRWTFKYILYLIGGVYAMILGLYLIIHDKL